jgi:FKBP-type peptidyl-prolyl cis-trans isomerase FklB
MFKTTVFSLIFLLPALAAVVFPQVAFAQDPAAPASTIEPAAEASAIDPALVKKASFIIGYNIAKNLEGVDVDRAELFRGFEQGLDGKPLGIQTAEIQSVMQAFQKFVEGEQIKKMKLASEKNRAEGEALLAQNGAKEGVKKLENGVQYEILNTGTGASPVSGNVVKIHYHGTVADGFVFDSSVDRNQPYELDVDRFVPGFSSALKAMKVGDKWRVVIPSDLAYGVEGPPGIGPNRTLIFELELLDIVK